MPPGLDVRRRAGGVQRRRGLVQRQRVVGDAESGMARGDILIDRELRAIATTMRLGFCLRGRRRDVIGDVIEELERLVDDDVLVSDLQQREIIVVDVMVVRGAWTVIVVGVVVTVRVAMVELDDRAIGRMRVVVVMSREMEVRQHLDTQQPQQRCGRRERAAVPGG